MIVEQRKPDTYWTGTGGASVRVPSCTPVFQGDLRRAIANLCVIDDDPRSETGKALSATQRPLFHGLHIEATGTFIAGPTPSDAGQDGSELRSARQLLSVPGVTVEGGDEFLGWLDVKQLGENVLSAVSALQEFITDPSIRVAPAGPHQEFGRHVVIYVSSTEDPEMFIDELDRFDDEWWCEQPASVTAPLGIYLG